MFVQPPSTALTVMVSFSGLTSGFLSSVSDIDAVVAARGDEAAIRGQSKSKQKARLWTFGLERVGRNSNLSQAPSSLFFHPRKSLSLVPSSSLSSTSLPTTSTLTHLDTHHTMVSHAHAGDRGRSTHPRLCYLRAAPPPPTLRSRLRSILQPHHQHSAQGASCHRPKKQRRPWTQMLKLDWPS